MPEKYFKAIEVEKLTDIPACCSSARLKCRTGILQQNDQFVRSLDDFMSGVFFLQSTQNEDSTWSDSSYGSQPGVLGMAVLLSITW